jgi:hypothetical protein
MKYLFYFSLVLSVAFGICIAWIDTSPGWDDTGITFFLLLISSLICGFTGKKKPWLIGLLLGIWIPIFNIISAHNYGSLIAIFPAFVGAFVGWFISRIIKK